MDPITRLLMQGAAGAAGEKVYIEDVFSTWLYTGNGNTQTITNGIDLSGEGGLVWIKSRNQSYGHRLVDSARTNWRWLETNSTSAENTGDNRISPTSSGFTLNSNSPGAEMNNSSVLFASWTFRKAAKFFDVVTYTGTGSARTVAHNLGSVPGCIIVKSTSQSDNWKVYHRSLTSNAYYILLDSTAAQSNAVDLWNSTTPTSTEFSIGSSGNINTNGATYVAYLFAHDAGGFGDSGNESVVKCGSYTGSASAVAVNLGWEPQWLLVKKASGATSAFTNWAIFDNMRGVTTGGSDVMLAPNLSTQEGGTNMYPSTNLVDFSPTGFTVDPTASQYSVVNTSGDTYIYIAIRRGPMKTPTDATKVFNAVAYAGTGVGQTYTTGFPVDMTIVKTRGPATTNNGELWDRMRPWYAYLFPDTTAGDGTAFGTTNQWLVDRMDSVKWNGGDGFSNSSSNTYATWNFRRAPGFFDVVAYTGVSSSDQQITHSLGKAPELIIVKSRALTSRWLVYASSLGRDKYTFLDLANATSTSTNAWGTVDPTATTFNINNISIGYAGAAIAYLFATCPGVSKCFNYTGTGTTKQIDCGFTNGARLVLIKRTDSTGDWYIWDSARGIISGNDPYLLLNSSAAEVTSTDYIDPYSAGFEISSTAPAAINANGGSYIGLAIA